MALFYRAPALFDKGRGRRCSLSWWRELVPLCELDKGCGQLPWQFSDCYEPFERCKYSLLESCVQRGLNRQAVDRLSSEIGWRDFDWGSVIFSDETSISSDCESRGHVYREPGSRYDTRYIQWRERLGRFTLSCSGRMPCAGVGVLKRIQGQFNAPQYQHIFEKVMLRSATVRNPEGNLIFQQDNHSVRCSMGVQRWFSRRPEIELIPWPPTWFERCRAYVG